MNQFAILYAERFVRPSVWISTPPWTRKSWHSRLGEPNAKPIVSRATLFAPKTGLWAPRSGRRVPTHRTFLLGHRGNGPRSRASAPDARPFQPRHRIFERWRRPFKAHHRAFEVRHRRLLLGACSARPWSWGRGFCTQRFEPDTLRRAQRRKPAPRPLFPALRGTPKKRQDRRPAGLAVDVPAL